MEYNEIIEVNGETGEPPMIQKLQSQALLSLPEWRDPASRQLLQSG